MRWTCSWGSRSHCQAHKALAGVPLLPRQKHNWMERSEGGRKGRKRERQRQREETELINDRRSSAMLFVDGALFKKQNGWASVSLHRGGLRKKRTYKKKKKEKEQRPSSWTVWQARCFREWHRRLIACRTWTRKQSRGKVITIPPFCLSF